MKTFPLLIAGLALLSLTQCVGPGPGPRLGPPYYSGSDYGSPFYNYPYYGYPYYGYGRTGWLAGYGLWSGVGAYGVHQRNEIRHDRVDHAMKSYHHPQSGGIQRVGRPPSGGGRPPGGGSKPSGGGGIQRGGSHSGGHGGGHPGGGSRGGGGIHR